MIFRVFADLQIFILFFSILITFFALILAVIGIGNDKYGPLKE